MQLSSSKLPKGFEAPIPLKYKTADFPSVSVNFSYVRSTIKEQPLSDFESQDSSLEVEGIYIILMDSEVNKICNFGELNLVQFS